MTTIGMYLALIAIFSMGSDKVKRISMVIGVCINSFLSYSTFSSNILLTVIYLVVGMICILIYSAYDSDNTSNSGKAKNKYVAAMISLILGSVGAHKFYLRKRTAGLVYLLFSWTIIPFFVGIFEAVCLLCMEREKFNQKYNAAPSQAKQSTVHQPDNSTRKRNDARNSSNKNNYYKNEHSSDYYSQHQTTQSEENTDCEIVNYPMIHLQRCDARISGKIDNFIIQITINGNRFDFRATDGDIRTYRAFSMRSEQEYGV